MKGKCGVGVLSGTEITGSDFVEYKSGAHGHRMCETS
jgi:hypothetical protein